MGGEGARVKDALAEVQRVRTLNRISEPPLAVNAAPDDEEGAREIIEQTLATFGRLDGVVHAIRPAPGTPSVALGPLLPMFRHAALAMRRQVEGRILLALDLGCDSHTRLSPAERSRLDASFEMLIRATANASFARELCVNGLIVDPGEPRVDQSLALAGMGASCHGFRPAENGTAYMTASGLVALLASATNCGITGQVFRIGWTPPKPTPGSELAAFLNTSLHLS
jgi:hypothetical protein